MRTLLVVAILTLTMLAGCSGDAATLTALETRSAADAAAQDWSSDAALVGVATFEIGDEIKKMIRRQVEALESSGELDDEDMSAEDRAMLEAMLASHDAPGDGVALFWAFLYASQERQAIYAVLVDAGGVSYAEEVPMGWGGATPYEDQSDEFPPVSGWEVDSDEAARIASDADEAYARLRGDDEAMGIAALGQDGDDPYWFLMIMKLGMGSMQGAEPGPAQGDGDWDDSEWEDDSDWEDNFEAAMVVVNARTGEVVPLEDFESYDFESIVVETGDRVDQIYAEMGSASGELTVVAPTDEQGFTIEQDGHQALAIAVEASNPLLGPVEVVVTDPEGRETPFTVDLEVGLTSRQVVVLDFVPAGDWTVSLALDPALRHQYTLEWCTDGIGMPSVPFMTAVAICDEVDGGGSEYMPIGADVRDFLLGQARQA